VLICVMCSLWFVGVPCVLSLTVVPLPPSGSPFAVDNKYIYTQKEGTMPCTF
jgi:hypothetical protein